MTATLASGGTPLSELIMDADAIWTDVASVKESQTLKELLNAEPSITLPLMVIVHGDGQELNSLEPGLSMSKSVVLVKLPIIMAEMVDILMNPEPHIGLHAVQSRVRFALPQGTPMTTPLEERKEIFTPESTETLADDEEREKDRVLLVEDNLVRVSRQNVFLHADCLRNR